MCSLYRYSSGQVFWLSWRNRGICRPGATSRSSRPPAEATSPGKPSKRGRWVPIELFNSSSSVPPLKRLMAIKYDSEYEQNETALYFVLWAAFEVRVLRGECTSICCRTVCPSGLHQDFIRAAYNKSPWLCPQLADNVQSDCLQGHTASHSALHHGWIDPSLLVSSFTPTLTLWYPVYIYASVHTLFWSKINTNAFLWRCVQMKNSSLKTTAESMESCFPFLPHGNGVR